MKKLWIKNQYFQLIKSRQKTLEARINYPNLRGIKKGNVIFLKTKSDKIRVKIVEVRKYKNFQKVLECEDVNQLLPETTRKDALKLYEKIYPDWKVNKYGGVLIFELETY